MTGEKKPLAFVTGSGVRLGRAIAVGLAQDGYIIGLHYYKSKKEAEETAELIQNVGTNAFLFSANLQNSDEIQSLFTQVDETGHPLKIWVNSAAVMMHRKLTDCSVSDWDLMMGLNLRAPWLCGIEAANRMVDGGVIINITDIGIEKNWTGYAPYLVSKAGLEMLTRLMAREFAPRVRVNAVAPGLILPSEDISPQAWEKLIGAAPMHRSGSATDVVTAIRFLIKNQYITGTTLHVDGGYRLI